MLLENEPRKSPKWKPFEIPEAPGIVPICIIIPARRSVPESVTKWPRWLFPNASSHSTRMGAKLVLIESVIHRCSPPGEGGSRHKLLPTFPVDASTRAPFFSPLRHREKQTGPQVNKQMNFITIKVRNSVRVHYRAHECKTGARGDHWSCKHLYLQLHLKYMEKSRRGKLDEKCTGRRSLQHSFLQSKPKV